MYSEVFHIASATRILNDINSISKGNYDFYFIVHSMKTEIYTLFKDGDVSYETFCDIVKKYYKKYINFVDLNRNYDVDISEHLQLYRDIKIRILFNEI